MRYKVFTLLNVVMLKIVTIYLCYGFAIEIAFRRTKFTPPVVNVLWICAHVENYFPTP